jgi:starch-binding outer membrane protein, SusD/RagB family
MKNIIKYITVVVIMITAFSCDLDRYPYNAIEQSQSFKTVADAGAIRNGLYANLRGRLYGIYMFSTDVQADMLNATLDFGNRNGFPHRWDGFLDTDYTIRDIWQAYYSALVNVNNAITNLPSITTTTEAEAATLNAYIGEAHLMRAFYYHQLILRWGKPYNSASASSDPGVPLVLTFDVTLKPARASVAEVYTQILADIAEAKSKLAGVAGAASSSKLTVDAAVALEARVHLHMRNWSAAATAAKSLISGGKYPLINTAAGFKNMWVTDTSSEVIFQLQLSAPSELGNTNAIYLGLRPSDNKYTPDFIPQNWIIDLYSDSDIRKDAYLEKKPVIVQGADYPDIWVINKYPGNPALFTAATTNYQHKPKVFRVAEMYLIAAEADAQTSAGEAAALATLNQLRVARGLDALAGLAGANLMNEIRTERTRELLVEGFRLDDLNRWNLGFTRSTPQNMNLINTGEHYNLKTVSAGDPKFTWGIPANDLTTNPNITQNPGW